MANVIEILIKANDQASSVFRSVGKGVVGVGASVAAVGAAVAAELVVASKAAMESEVAEQALATALRNVRGATADTHAELVAYASRLQDATGVEDEAILGAESLFATFGAGTDVIGRATAASLDLSAALGMELTGASMLLAKAGAGNTAMLGKFGLSVDAAAVKSRGLVAVVEAMEQRFGGTAAERMRTFEGATTRVVNSVGDLQEVIGGSIVKSAAIREALGSTAEFVQLVSAKIAESGVSLGQGIVKGAALTAHGLGQVTEFVAWAGMGLNDFVRDARLMNAFASQAFLEMAAAGVRGLDSLIVGARGARLGVKAELLELGAELLQGDSLPAQLFRLTPAFKALEAVAGGSLDEIAAKARGAAAGTRAELATLPKVGSQALQDLAGGLDQVAERQAAGVTSAQAFHRENEAVLLKAEAVGRAINDYAGKLDDAAKNGDELASSSSRVGGGLAAVGEKAKGAKTALDVLLEATKKVRETDRQFEDLARTLDNDLRLAVGAIPFDPAVEGAAAFEEHLTAIGNSRAFEEIRIDAEETTRQIDELSKTGRDVTELRTRHAILTQRRIGEEAQRQELEAQRKIEENAATYTQIGTGIAVNVAQGVKAGMEGDAMGILQSAVAIIGSVLAASVPGVGGIVGGGLFGGLGQILGIFHGGGVLGRGAGRPQLYAHDGLLLGRGLRGGEVPFVGWQDEGILTPRTTGNLGGSFGVDLANRMGSLSMGNVSMPLSITVAGGRNADKAAFERDVVAAIRKAHMEQRDELFRGLRALVPTSSFLRG